MEIRGGHSALLEDLDPARLEADTEHCLKIWIQED